MTRWTDPCPLASVRGADLRSAGLVFATGPHLYGATGAEVGHGGMGNAYVLERRHVDEPDRPGVEVVGKVFHAEYLYQLRTDEVTMRDYDMVVRNAPDLVGLDHPNLLPLYVAAPLSDNFLTVTPRMAGTLRAAVSSREVSPRRRVELFVQALRGLDHLHRAGFVHRDVTLRNILVDDALTRALLFDFDLTLPLAEVAGQCYLDHYQGRVFGSPGYSVPPEVVDDQLMARPISQRLDLYAVGGGLFALFTDELPYGPTEDMYTLLVRISEGVVFRGHSKIAYPPAVPPPLRPIIERCLERDPDARAASVAEVIGEIEAVLGELDAEVGQPRAPRPRAETHERLTAIHAAVRDRDLSFEEIAEVDGALAYHGFQVDRALGRVKGYPIYLASPVPDLVADGTFPDASFYPKIVTALSLRGRTDQAEQVDLWLGGYLPILRVARQGLLTALDRAVWDEARELLLLFSEYVDDARFGRELDHHELTLREAFGLGYLVTGQVRRLHRRGLAHNNVCAASLLLKGLARSREVHPAMVGMVAPSFAADDMATDVRQLAGLTLSWLRSSRVAELGAEDRARVLTIVDRIDSLSRAPQPTIAQLSDVLADGLAALDGNFAVLREHGGDLQAHALLLVSHSLFGRLWD